MKTNRHSGTSAFMRTDELEKKFKGVDVSNISISPAAFLATKPDALNSLMITPVLFMMHSCTSIRISFHSSLMSGGSLFLALVGASHTPSSSDISIPSLSPAIRRQNGDTSRTIPARGRLSAAELHPIIR